ncbi:aromatic acid/H+ symport family MFS transporter [Rhodococcus fascians]|nr:aromatic acid/H+ symport family MFS transporter [Rhodococcus fascians]MBY4237883.1 aromatic acid/H+ symport family MFS transporter [Rhodococcus fascians]MBY4253366.1 aromatic acid/H+ symport family MFS transporter [Rhodococcus fascians]MBY4269003.1 aromatic acid/H+ symport family MFS transporter [Rhodococcus fascians]
MSNASASNRTVVAACCAVLVVEGFDLAMFGSIVPSLREYEPWGVDASMIGYMGSAAVFGMLIGALLAAVLVDRIGRRPVVIGAVVLFSASMGLSAVAPDSVVFLVLRLLIGIGAGAVMPTVAATLIEFAPAGRRSRNTALGFIGVGIGGMVSATLAVWLVPAFGFRAMCLVGALPLVITVPILTRWFPESPAVLDSRGRNADASTMRSRYGLEDPDLPTASEESLSRLSIVFGDGRARGTLLFWAATFCCLLVTFGVSTWLPDLMRSGGYGLTGALWFLVALKGGSVVGVLIAADLADRFGQKPVVASTSLCSALALLALTLTPSVALAYVLVTIVGLGTTGLQILINAFVGSYYPAHVRGTGLGLNLSVGRVGGILGPVYLGWFVVQGIELDTKFYALALPAVVAALLLALVPTRRRDAPDTCSPRTKSKVRQ